METQTLTPDQEATIAAFKINLERFFAKGVRPTKKAVLVLPVIEEAVQDSKRTSLGGAPEGHLYAAVSGLLGLDEFQSIIAVLKAEKKVKVSYHLVTWIGR